MSTSIQGVSQGGGTATVGSLHVWGGLSRTVQARVLASPSWITTLGAGGDVASVSYETSDLLRTFSPVTPSPGLSAAQQRELAFALGLGASATGTGVLGAIDTLLVPADASQVMVNVLVGDASATVAETSPTNPFLYNSQGVIEGLSGSGAGQAPTLLDSGIFGAAASNANSTSIGGVADNPFTAGAEAASDNIPTNMPMAELDLATAGHTAMLGSTAVATNPADAVTVAANPADVAVVATIAAGVVASAVPAAEYVPVANLNFAVYGGVAMLANTARVATPAANTEAGTATVAGGAAITMRATTAATNAASTYTPVAGAVATAVTPVDVADAATRTLQGLPAANVIQLPGNLPMEEMNVVAAEAATALVAVSAAAELGAVARVATPVAAAPFTASDAPTATAVTANTIPVIRFDNARSVLQSLLAESSVHAIMIQRNPATATYSVGGAMFQMGTGADHVPPYIMRGFSPDIRDVVRPVSPAAGMRGFGGRKT